MNYYILTPFFPSSLSFRGSYLLDQAKAIKRLTNYNVKVIILTPFFSRSFKQYTIDEIDCFTFKVMDFPSFILPGFFNEINLIRFKRFLVLNQISVSSDTYIHGHINYPSSYFLNYFKTRFNTKTILQHHGLDIVQSDTGVKLPFIKSIQNKFIVNQFRYSKRYIDKHIAVSDKVKKELLKLDPSLNDNIVVCINGVDRSKFFKKEKHKSTYFRIGCVANFWELKDQITLLRAVKKLKSKGIKNLKITFVGVGPTLSSCKQFALKHGINSDFIAQMKHNELVDLYNEIDLFVLPSYYEAFGCVYLESLACGTPFIAVKGQGIEDALDEKYKSIQLFAKKNVEELSKLIAYFYKNNITIPFNDNFEISNVVLQMLKNLGCQIDE